MALVYLKHPVHGQKVESNDIIAAMDRANGWVDFDPSAEVPVASVEPEVVVQPAAGLPAFLTAPVADPPKGKKPKG